MAEDPVRIRPVSQDMDVPPLLKAVPEAVEGVADGRVCQGKALGQVLEEPVPEAAVPGRSSPACLFPVFSRVCRILPGTGRIPVFVSAAILLF